MTEEKKETLIQRSIYMTKQEWFVDWVELVKFHRVASRPELIRMLMRREHKRVKNLEKNWVVKVV